MSIPGNEIHVFESLDAFVEASGREPSYPHPKGSRMCDQPAESFSGNATYRQAVDFARHGWPEGRKKAQALMLDFQAKALSDVSAPETVLDVTGLQFDVGLVLSGEPECWLDQQDRPARGAVKLVVGCSMSAAVQESTIIRRGVAIAALIDRLEAQRVRVELVVEAANRGPRTNKTDPIVSVQVTVKRAQDLLDLDRIAFVLGHPAYNRRLQFTFWETLAPKTVAYLGARGSGPYGWNCPPIAKADASFNSLFCSHDDYSEFHSDAAALAWIKRTADQIFNGAPSA